MTLTKLIRVGFWRPNTDARPGGVAVILAELLLGGMLPDVRRFVDPTWNKQEREAVLAYVEDRRFRQEAYFGFSQCRICNRENGCADFSDGIYEWPEGFGHYIREHHIRPPHTFVQHVLGRAR